MKVRQRHIFASYLQSILATRFGDRNQLPSRQTTKQREFVSVMSALSTKMAFLNFRSTSALLPITLSTWEPPCRLHSYHSNICPMKLQTSTRPLSKTPRFEVLQFERRHALKQKKSPGTSCFLAQWEINHAHVRLQSVAPA